MAVDTPYQRQGYGKEIMNFALKIITQQSTKKVRLEVRTTNVIAIKFYEKLGFHIIGKLENYYDDQGDAFLMLKEV
jgi:ribosomal protein S18 acetylase RimI-like enzyme